MAERIYGNTELLIGAGTRSAKNAKKKKGELSKKNKEKSWGRERRTGEERARQGCAIRTSAAIKGIRREDALSSGTSRSLIAEGKRGRSSRGAVRDGAFTEKKPSGSLVEIQFSHRTANGSARSWRVRRVRRSRGKRGALARARKRDRATLYRPTIELRRSDGGATVTLISADAELSVLPGFHRETFFYALTPVSQTP